MVPAHHINTVRILHPVWVLSIITSSPLLPYQPPHRFLIRNDRRPDALSLPLLTAADTFSSWSLWLLNPLLPRSGIRLPSPADLFGDDIHEAARTAAAIQW